MYTYVHSGPSATRICLWRRTTSSTVSSQSSLGFPGLIRSKSLSQKTHRSTRVREEPLLPATTQLIIASEINRFRQYLLHYSEQQRHGVPLEKRDLVEKNTRNRDRLHGSLPGLGIQEVCHREKEKDRARESYTRM